MTNQRNAFGFPILSKLDAAKEYAAAAKIRNAQGVRCSACLEAEKLARVQRITGNWK